MPLFLLPLLLIPLMFGLGAWLAWRVILTRPALPAPRPPPAPAPERSLERSPEPAPPAPDPEEDELLRYPRRLAELEAQVLEAHRQTQQQLQHLSLRGSELAAKGGRDEIAARYAADVAALDRRAAALRRALGTVWRTRAMLLLRVRLALVARQRPDLRQLPDPNDVRPEDLDQAAGITAQAGLAVRRFVTLLDAEVAQVPELPPAPPLSAELTEAQRQSLETEQQETLHTLLRLRERMDRLADVLDYVTDRLRTRKLVVGSPIQLDLEPQAGRLLEEVSQALTELDQLSDLGDRGLEDESLAAVEGLGPLERLALSAKAEAEASVEVEDLLKRLER